MKFGEGQFGEELFGGRVRVLAGRIEAASTAELAALKRRVPLRGSIAAEASATLTLAVVTPLRAAPARGLRVMGGARVA